MGNPEHHEPLDNPEETPKKKSARTLRQQENKNKNDFVIKCSLNQGILARDDFKKEIVNNINKRVEQVSKMAQKVSIAVNIMVRECIEHGQAIPLFLSEGKGDTFLRQIATICKDAKNPDPFVQEHGLFFHSLTTINNF
jgi:predicted HicB family RNase H-like nuclease